MKFRLKSQGSHPGQVTFGFERKGEGVGPHDYLSLRGGPARNGNPLDIDRYNVASDYVPGEGDSELLVPLMEAMFDEGRGRVTEICLHRNHLSVINDIFSHELNDCLLGRAARVAQDAGYDVEYPEDER